MTPPSEPEVSFGTGARCKRALAEAAGVLIAGAILALAANALSPRGLSLTRDYFPAFAPAPVLTTQATNTPPNIPTTNLAVFPTAATNASPNPVPPATNAVAARLQARGLQLIEHAEVIAAFRDPRSAQDQFLFVDARNDQHYQEGHIPGALQLDYYHLDQYLGPALAACQIAEKIIVYCTGGDCEDSELTAALLGRIVPREKIFVYTGGFTQWSATAQPVETGARKSGVLKGAGAKK